mgnify:FL=1
MVNDTRFCVECGVAIKEQNRAPRCNKCRYKQQRSARDESHKTFLQHKLIKARARAKEKKLEFDLNIKFLVTLYETQNGRCAVSGLPMTHSSENTDLSISIDRLDNDFGYTTDNVRLVCNRVNLMRNKLSVEMFDWWCRTLGK